MEYNLELAALRSEYWSNNACRGYVIYATENCGFALEDIQHVIDELHFVFDSKELCEAQQHYEESPY